MELQILRPLRKMKQEVTADSFLLFQTSIWSSHSVLWSSGRPIWHHLRVRFWFRWPAAQKLRTVLMIGRVQVWRYEAEMKDSQNQFLQGQDHTGHRTCCFLTHQKRAGGSRRNVVLKLVKINQVKIFFKERRSVFRLWIKSNWKASESVPLTLYLHPTWEPNLTFQ